MTTPTPASAAQPDRVAALHVGRQQAEDQPGQRQRQAQRQRRARQRLGAGEVGRRLVKAGGAVDQEHARGQRQYLRPGGRQHHVQPAGLGGEDDQHRDQDEAEVREDPQQRLAVQVVVEDADHLRAAVLASSGLSRAPLAALASAAGLLARDEL
jgi:hypothetical protein